MEAKPHFCSSQKRCFDVLQEILQHGRAFDVEKVLSDERYQSLKVSAWKTLNVLLQNSEC